ncbi:uncharacterized protein LOC121371627 [Gigantopelta aegis]|uniref:uncharacterized protein LOC121371627 n=1 Tax=Gigantopelta aegis TaxID=1735272 RepID=UPI001B887E08|nr:uncharacterized protein LOC121371627 [Gigantopelta aegis]
MGCSEASKFVKIALGICIAAFLFHLVAFPTPYWIQINTSFSGLFMICGLGFCVTYTENLKTTKLKATTAMEMLGFFVGLACLVVTAGSLFIKSLTQKKIKIAGMVLAFVAAFLILLGVIIYGAENNERPVPIAYGWSFILEIIAGLLFIATGVMLVLDLVMGSS